jgi:hypothetical protein
VSIGNPQDGHVQVATDGPGKKIDNAELIRDDGTVVERQRVSIGSDDNPRTQMEVSGEAGKGKANVEDKSQDVVAILIEIRDLLRLVIGA